MSVFTPTEIEFLRHAQLARLATAGADGRPHISPVTFRLNEDGTIDIGGGWGFAKRKKWRDMQANPAVAIAVDDVLPPWRPRCIEVRGVVEFFNQGGKAHLGDGYDEEWVRLHPHRIVSFGIADGGGNRDVATENAHTMPTRPS
jgi:pyridoxamine 5'-phosphate oxidase family protein